MAKGKPILCLDFDGVIHTYISGWKGADVIPDPIHPGAVEFLENAVDHFDVQIHSSRSHQPGGIEAMQGYLRRNVLAHYGVGLNAHQSRVNRAAHVLDNVSFPMHKPAAFVTIDDRALTFTGVFPAIEQLTSFKPWNKR